MNKAVFDEVSVLWTEHRGLTFPDDLRRVEVHGEPVAYLDFCKAGPLTGYVGSQRGALDPAQFRVARRCARDLRALLRRRDGRTYVVRLLQIADLITGDAAREAHHEE
ncbi:hypothetical protein [Planomonospora algeriensis]